MKELLNNYAIGQLVRAVYERQRHREPFYAGFLREDVINLLRRIRNDYEDERALLYARIEELRAVTSPALVWIDEIYPADVFDGSSLDEGPVRIVAIRENLRRALQKE